MRLALILLLLPLGIANAEPQAMPGYYHKLCFNNYVPTQQYYRTYEQTQDALACFGLTGYPNLRTAGFLRATHCTPEWQCEWKVHWNVCEANPGESCYTFHTGFWTEQEFLQKWACLNTGIDPGTGPPGSHGYLYQGLVTRENYGGGAAYCMFPPFVIDRR